MKQCTTCKATKPESEFYVRPHRRRANELYVVPSCKACTVARSREWCKLYRTKERIAIWDANKKIQLARIKDAVFGAYGGYVCACCGETERNFLTLDHISNDGATWRREKFSSRNVAGTRTYRWLVKHSFPPGFQILCMNCNWGKRYLGECPHRVKRNDYPLVGVGSSDPKRTAPVLRLVPDDEIVSSAMKVAAVRG